MLRARLRQLTLALINLAAAVVRELSRMLLRDRRTTTAGVALGLAYLAARHNFVVPEAAQPYVVAAAFVVLGALARDSQPKGHRQ